MALIAMAVHDTVENNRSQMTMTTLASLWNTVMFMGDKHRLIICDNGSCQTTLDFYKQFEQDTFRRQLWAQHLYNSNNPPFQVIYNEKNIGTARAINKAWMLRKEKEFCVKMDDDVKIYQPGWLDQCVEVMKVDTTIGICALKRKDCLETPWNKDEWYRSKLVMLPHVLGEKWIIVEEVNHAMGTVQVYSPYLLDKIGYLYQMGGLYGFDDALACIRAHQAGFRTVFLPHIEIDHIDPGGDDYTEWKQDYGWEMMEKFNKTKALIMSGKRSYYYGPEDE